MSATATHQEVASNASTLGPNSADMDAEGKYQDVPADNPAEDEDYDAAPICGMNICINITLITISLSILSCQ